MEDHVGFGSSERQVADLVEHQDRRLQIGLQLLGEPSGALGVAELADHVVEGGGADREPGLAGGDGQADRQHGLANPGRAEEGNVGSGLDEAEGGEGL